MVRVSRYPVLGLVQPPAVLGGHAELVVAGGDVAANRCGFGLVLQVGQGPAVGQRGLVRLPCVLLPGGLSDGGAQPQWTKIRLTVTADHLQSDLVVIPDVEQTGLMGWEALPRVVGLARRAAHGTLGSDPGLPSRFGNC
jgi:hypothetical protein